MQKLIFIISFIMTTAAGAADWNAGVGIGPGLGTDSQSGLKDSWGAALWLTRKWSGNQRLDISLDRFQFTGENQSYSGLSLGYGLNFFEESQWKPFISAGPGFGIAGSFPGAATSTKAVAHLFLRAGVEELFKTGKFKIGLMYDYTYAFLNDPAISKAQFGVPMLTLTWDIWRPDPESSPFAQEKAVTLEAPPAVKDMVQFKSGRADVQSQYLSVIEEFGKRLKESKNAKLRIEGHSDSSGSRVRNVRLSEKRAIAVKKILVKKWKSESMRIATAGYGSDQSVASNEDSAGREKNRRAKIILLP